MNQEPMPTNTSHASTPNNNVLRQPQDFSLVLGGPLFHLLCRSHLSGVALELLRQRILIISLFAWLPLLALSALEGQALGGRAAVPFLMDFEVHVRFLVALLLLIVAESVVHQRMRFVVRQFLAQFDSRRRFAAFRCRDRVGVSSAQLGACRAAADRFRVYRRCPDNLAPIAVKSTKECEEWNY